MELGDSSPQTLGRLSWEKQDFAEPQRKVWADLAGMKLCSGRDSTVRFGQWYCPGSLASALEN